MTKAGSAEVVVMAVVDAMKAITSYRTPKAALQYRTSLANRCFE
jgi:hypothetical protein